jgi:hypothetical protein
MNVSPFTRKERIVFILFVLVGIVNILAHEIWRDEFQAFLIAKESVSIPDMLERMKFEGHPPLWHILLYAVTRFSGDPISMQILHLVIACGSAYLILRFPLPWWQRALMIFGYFPLFEFLAISRNYAVGFLLCNILLFMITAERKRYLSIALLLFLLCLSSTQGIIMASLIVFYLLMDLYSGKESWKSRPGILVAYLGIILSGMFLSMWTIAPPQDSYIEIPACLPLEFDRWRFSAVIRTIWKCYIPIPIFQMNFWDTNFLEIRFVRSGLTFGIIAMSIAMFFPKRKIFYLYSLGTLSLLIFSYFILVGQMRHFGHQYILFVMCLVLYACDQTKPRPFRLLSEKAEKIFIVCILTSQVIAGVLASYLSWNYPFTAGKAVASYIREHGLEDRVIMGDRDWALATVSGHLGKPLYHLVIRREATYVVWNNERAEILTPFQIVELANEMEHARQKKVLVILNYELEPEERENLVLIKEFARCILTDEKFYLYEIDPSRSRPVMKNTGKGDSLPGDNHFRFLQARADRHTEP